MSDLPPVKYLDIAAKAGGYRDWQEVLQCNPSGTGLIHTSIIAHARTLEKFAQHDPAALEAFRGVGRG